MMRETFYLGRDNPIRFTPCVGKRGETPRPMTASEIAGFTKWELHYLGVYYASNTHAGLFDVETFAADSEIQVDLGVIDSLPPGEDTVEIIGYHEDFPKGRPIGSMQLVVSDELMPSA